MKKKKDKGKLKPAITTCFRDYTLAYRVHYQRRLEERRTGVFLTYRKLCFWNMDTVLWSTRNLVMLGPARP